MSTTKNLSLVALLLLPMASNATPIFYTDRASFEQAIDSVRVYDLDDHEPIFLQNAAYWIRYDGMELIVDFAERAVIDQGEFLVSGHTATIRFDEPQDAVGLDFSGQTSDLFAVWALTEFDGLFKFDLSGTGFWGMKLDAGAPRIEKLYLMPFGRRDGNLVASPFTISNVTSVPEPATLSLLAAGLLAMYVRRRRNAV